MSIKPPPRFVAHAIQTPSYIRRRRLWLTIGWAGSLIVAATLGLVIAHNLRRVSEQAHGKALRAQIDRLKQELATLGQARAIDTMASKRLQRTLSERDKEISGLRADLSFYTGLIDGSQRHGLRLQGVRLSRIAKSPRAWNLTLTLTQDARQRQQISGSLSVVIEGIHQHQVQRLTWKQLTEGHTGNSMDYRFKYFQRLHSTLLLPVGFNPNRLLISVSPKHAKGFTRAIAWTQAQKQREITYVQQH